MLTQTKEKYQEVLQVAENLFQQSPDWVTFFREILGVEGTVRRSFPSLDQLNEFEQSEPYDRIQKMLVKLREQRTVIDEESEPTRVITVRLPKSMHESLRTEAHDLRTSMNKLCISKLLRVIGEDLIPNERSAPEAPSRSRMPAPASGDHTNGLASSSISMTASGQMASESRSPGMQAPSLGQGSESPPPFKSSQARF